MATSTDNIVQEVSDTQNTEKNQDDLLFSVGVDLQSHTMVINLRWFSAEF
jgi:hypothetical protein